MYTFNIEISICRYSITNKQAARRRAKKDGQLTTNLSLLLQFQWLAGG
jgi:hypothetical protein